MSPQLLIFTQSDYLIQVVDTNSNTEWQTVQIQINWLLKGKEFAPWVSFLLENTPFQKEVGVEESKQVSPKVVSLIKHDSNTVKYI